jgi:hypothetical protein
MRYRFTFLAGLAVGFVMGARAGRERYEQMKKLARKAADSPAMQQAAGAAQAQAASLARSAKDRAAQRLPRITEKANKVSGTLHDRLPGMRTRDANGHSTADGAYPATPGTGGPSPS